MNNLSILIYLADVVNGLTGIAVATAIIGAIATMIALIIAVVTAGERDRPNVKPFLKWSIPVTIIAAFICVVLPSRQTFMLIAASEIGETVLKNEQVKATIDPSIELLQTWIKKERDTLMKSMQKDK